MAYGAFVQSTGVDSGTAIAASLAFFNDLVATNTIVVGARFSASPGTVTCTDTRGHIFQLIRAEAGVVDIYWWYVGSVTGGADIVSITTTNAVTYVWAIAEFEGSSVLGVQAASNETGSSVTSGNLVTSVAAALIVGFAGAESQRSFTPGVNYTEREEVEQRVALVDRVVGATGTYAVTMTLSSSTSWVCVGAAFYASGSGTSYVVSLSGVVAPVGLSMGRVNMVLSGVLVVSGEVVKGVNKAVSGALTVSGGVVSSFRRVVSIGGVVSGVGGIVVDYIVGTGLISGLAMLFRRRRR
jgi:hypothetical protein